MDVHTCHIYVPPLRITVRHFFLFRPPKNFWSDCKIIDLLQWVVVFCKPSSRDLSIPHSFPVFDETVLFNGLVQWSCSKVLFNGLVQRSCSKVLFKGLDERSCSMVLVNGLGQWSCPMVLVNGLGQWSWSMVLFNGLDERVDMTKLCDVCQPVILLDLRDTSRALCRWTEQKLLTTTPFFFVITLHIPQHKQSYNKAFLSCHLSIPHSFPVFDNYPVYQLHHLSSGASRVHEPYIR